MCQTQNKLKLIRLQWFFVYMIHPLQFHKLKESGCRECCQKYINRLNYFHIILNFILFLNKLSYLLNNLQPIHSRHLEVQQHYFNRLYLWYFHDLRICYFVTDSLYCFWKCFFSIIAKLTVISLSKLYKLLFNYLNIYQLIIGNYDFGQLLKILL